MSSLRTVHPPAHNAVVSPGDSVEKTSPVRRHFDRSFLLTNVPNILNVSERLDNLTDPSAYNPEADLIEPKSHTRKENATTNGTNQRRYTACGEEAVVRV